MFVKSNKLHGYEDANDANAAPMAHSSSCCAVEHFSMDGLMKHTMLSKYISQRRKPISKSASRLTTGNWVKW
jgi:mevalonate pyrophosphate decarboxylase